MEEEKEIANFAAIDIVNVAHNHKDPGRRISLHKMNRILLHHGSIVPISPVLILNILNAITLKKNIKKTHSIFFCI